VEISVLEPKSDDGRALHFSTGLQSVCGMSTKQLSGGMGQGWLKSASSNRVYDFASKSAKLISEQYILRFFSRAFLIAVRMSR
jgi:hypothetical protein